MRDLKSMKKGVISGTKCDRDKLFSAERGGQTDCVKL